MERNHPGCTLHKAVPAALIDQIVYKLYGLTAEEIRLVEESTN